MSLFKPGQRVLSESEPELGLGLIDSCDRFSVKVLFRATGESRSYALEGAPLRRHLMRIGDTVQDRIGRSHKIQALEDKGGLTFYLSQHGILPEAELADAISLSLPSDRILNGRCEDPAAFSLRRLALEARAARVSSPLLGLLGPRVDLIPHQLHVAATCAERRPLPRVLLSDEVGLGKTIEAGLILHRLLQTQRVTRAMILVPEPLVHQWFVEMYRKFNLWFSIIDEERCLAAVKHNKRSNPFELDPLVICPVSFLSGNPVWAAAAAAAGWDLLCVDEVHHLDWDPVKGASPAYSAVAAISANAAGLLLLSATPESLGEAGHFARLRLLDPQRFSDLEAYKASQSGFQDTARLAGLLLDAKATLKPDERKALARFLDGDEALIKIAALTKHSKEDRSRLVEALVDRHGTSRSVFRNTRKVMDNFPVRKPQIHILPLPASLAVPVEVDADDSAAQLMRDTEARLLAEGRGADPRVEWLASLVRSLKGAKVLAICSSQERALILEETIRDQRNVKLTMFHEGLSLAQRDRNAVFFQDPDGARLMIASEIGSEGRNFQFCHHLVLYDLPVSPGTLEQRIGRLDRIGQTEDIKIHIPCFDDSPHHAFARFCDEGLGLFSAPLHGCEALDAALIPLVGEVLGEYVSRDPNREASLEALIARAKEESATIRGRLDAGRDRLLEIHSYRPDKGKALVEAITAADNNGRLEVLFELYADRFGVELVDAEPGVWLMKAAQNLVTELPGVTQEGQLVTFSRRKSIVREDLTLLTWDHPLVVAMEEHLLAADWGNASFGHWKDAEARSIYLEALISPEALLPARLEARRWLPPTPIRILLNHKLELIESKFSAEELDANLVPGDLHRFLSNEQLRTKLLPAMLAAVNAEAQKRLAPLVKDAIATARAHFDTEAARLEALAKVNTAVRPEEAAALRSDATELATGFAKTTLRLDALRLIWRGSDKYLG